MCFLEYTDNSILANDIGTFFDSKIAKIRAELDVSTLHPRVVAEDKVFTGDGKLDHFNTYSVEDMRKLVSRLSKKSCQLDPMLTNLVVGMSDTLLPIITNIVNSSLSLKLLYCLRVLPLRENSQTANFKVFKDPMYFSRTFKALNFDFQIQGLSRTFKVRANPAQYTCVSHLK